MALGFDPNKLIKGLKGSHRQRRRSRTAEHEGRTPQPGIPAGPRNGGTVRGTRQPRYLFTGHAPTTTTDSLPTVDLSPGDLVSALSNLGGSPVGGNSNPVRNLAEEEAKKALEVAQQNASGIKPLVHVPSEKELRAAGAVTLPVGGDAVDAIRAGEKVASDSGAAAKAAKLADILKGGPVRRGAANVARKVEPDAVKAAREAVAERAGQLPKPVRVAGKTAAKVGSYPVRHPITAPLAIETPAALLHGGVGIHPSEYLAALEGKGTEASIANAASHIAPIVGEATNLPATVLPSLFLTGKAGVNAAQGNSKELHELWEQYLKTGVIPQTVLGGPSAGLKAAETHPIYSALEASGAASVLGRGAGVAARAFPGEFGAKSRRPLVPVEGTPTKVDRGNYSPDLIRQYFPHFGQRSRDKRVTSYNPDTARGKHYLKESINRETVGNRAVEVARTREALKALNNLLPRKGPTIRVGGHVVGKIDRKTVDIVGLAVERLFHDPSTFAENLPAYKRMIEEAAQQRDANGNLVLGPEEIKRNEENVKTIERALSAGPHRVEATVEAANAFIELQKPILAKMVELKLITEHQAAMASAIPYARIHMGATHGEPIKHYFDLERHYAETSLAHKGEARAALHGHIESQRTAKTRLSYAESGHIQAERTLATVRAKHPTIPGRDHAAEIDRASFARDAAKQRVTEAKAEVRQTNAVLQKETRQLKKDRGRKLNPIIEQLKQARKDGARTLDKHGYPLSLEDIHQHMAEHGIEPPGFISQREPTAGIHYKPNYGGGILEKGSRTGATALAGTHLFNLEGLVGTIKRANGLVSRAEAWNHVIEHFGTVIHGVKDMGDARKALKNPAAHGINPDADMVIVPRYPFAAKKTEIEGALEHQDPTTAADIGAEVTADALQEALKPGGANANIPDDTPVAFIPRTQAEQLLKDATPSSSLGKAAQAYTNIFKRAVLPFSPNFYIGNIFDNYMRTLLAGVNPAHLYFGAKAEKALTADDKAKLAQGAFFSSVENLAPHRSTENLVTGAGRVAHAIRDAAEWSRKYGVKQAAVKALPVILREVTHYLLATNAYVSEVLPQRGVIGKLAIADWEATGHSLTSAAFHVDELAKNFADGVASSPAALVRAQKGIEQVLGNYSRMSPDARKIMSNVVPFWTWTRAAYRFVYGTMPAHHPIETGFLAAAARATQLERETFGLDKQGKRPAPNWLQGAIPVGGGVLNLNRVSSFPYASEPQQAAGEAPFGQIRAVPESLLGVAGWKGSLLPGGEGSHLGAAAESFLGSVLPGWNLLTEEDKGKRKFAPHINILPKTYPKSELEELREPTQTITVPASGSSGGGSSGAPWKSSASSSSGTAPWKSESSSSSSEKAPWK